MNPAELKPGTVLRVDRRASVQFEGDRAITFRLIRVKELSHYDGWAWLSGYAVNKQGVAVERRDIFVQLAGLRLAGVPRQSATPRQSAR